jgi:uncharacterized Zn-binding protein involved in type VI secretion
MSVTANFLDIAGNATGHTVVYMAPSVCITPAAPSPMPMPYPIMTPTGTKQTKDHTGTVELNGQPVVCVGSLIASCTGNEPGTQKEIVSLNTSGAGFILQGSPDVKFNGSAVAYTTSQGMGNRL